MARNIKRIAKALGAKVVAQVPDMGGGAFGAARVAAEVEGLRERLQPGKGRGRPTNRDWVRHPKVPMSAQTERKLKQLARRASKSGRKVSPMQVAAHLLEEALDAYAAE